MKRIFVPTRSGVDWQRLLAKPSLHWKKGASAMTAAACWEASKGSLPREISDLLEQAHDQRLAAQRLLVAIPEWAVSLAGGTTTSNTDILAVCRNDRGLCVIAVEAKVLEDFGPLVGEKRAEASGGQYARLQYLQDLLGVAKFDDDVRYQLLHRTASALLTAREFHADTAVMLVHAFGTPPDRRADFERFAHAMTAQSVGPDVYRVARFAKPTLYLAWCKGDAQFLAAELDRMEIVSAGEVT